MGTPPGAGRYRTTDHYYTTCGKCGATRTDQQLGLEPTPEEYVTRMVEVFREVRRVLAPHGTVWLNLGDSYNGAGPNNQGRGSQSLNDGRADFPVREAIHDQDGRKVVGLKPKDLCMIPARLAMALQAPYYTGRIKKEADRVWLAAAIDGEGCIHIGKRAEGQPTGRNRTPRKADSFAPAVKVTNGSEAFVRRCHEIAGVGTVRVAKATPGERTFWEWTCYSAQARELLRELYPHFVAKQHEARIAHGAPTSGDDAAKAHSSLKAIHNGQTPDIDFAPPEPMWEPGWFLRSDIIWAKPNPMPESVTDRPTKAHEYVFLLSKQPRYFFDREAVREGFSEPFRASKGKFAATYREAQLQAQNGSRNLERTQPETGRNIRSVWEIATQPFSGRELFGGDGRIPSPDCPVHGDRPAPAPTARRDERAGTPSLRTQRSGAHLELEPQDALAPTEPLLEPSSAVSSSDSPDPDGSPLATASSTQTRKTTSHSGERDTAGGGTPDRTQDTEPSYESSGLGGSDSHETTGNPDRKSRTGTACTCKHIDHFATFPEELARRCIAAGCPEQVCRVCGKARERVVGRGAYEGRVRPLGRTTGFGKHLREVREVAGIAQADIAQHFPSRTGSPTGIVSNWETDKMLPPPSAYRRLKELLPALGYDELGLDYEGESNGGWVPEPDPLGVGNAKAAPTLTRSLETTGFTDCNHSDYRPGIVLDPFAGSGTTMHVARKLGRRSIGIDLSAEYLALAAKRLQQQSLFAETAS